MAKNGSSPKGPSMSQSPLKPFLRWAGGKRWLFESGQFSIPSFHGRYIEPFLGGGAVFFENQPQDAILSDANNRLVELYKVIRDDAYDLKIAIENHAKFHAKEYYYNIRSKNMEDSVSRAAQFLYLNRTCWNGLYRENAKGEFNVPIGTHRTVIYDSDDFFAWSRALQRACIEHQDFEATVDQATDGDFIFVDPPYTVRHNMNGFVKYNQTIFAWEDQIRLRAALERASGRGALFAMTNADHDSVKELYHGFGKHRQLKRHSVIAANSAHRASSTELLITI
jgi:DNA adenine methylase